MTEIHPAGATVVTPAQPPIEDGSEKIPDDTLITLALSVKQINYLLAVLGERPLKESFDLFNLIKGQGDMALKAMRMKNGSVEASPSPKRKR